MITIKFGHKILLTMTYLTEFQKFQVMIIILIMNKTSRKALTILFNLIKEIQKLELNEIYQKINKNKIKSKFFQKL